MDDDILQEFLAESWENLSRLDNEIVRLEKEPKNADLLASIFRTIHTIKGTCGFIGLTGLGGVAHAAENVLGQMRIQTLAATPTSISVVLEAIDEIKTLLQALEATGQEPRRDNTTLIAKLNDLAQGNAAATAGTGRVGADAETPNGGAPAHALTVERVPPVTVTPLVAAASSERQPSGTEIREEAEHTHPAAHDSGTGTIGSTEKKSVADLSIRVNVNVLDSLMNLVGELVLTRNQLLQLARGDDESKYAAPITHLNRVTTDLQEGVMKTRMQPIGIAWSKLPRMVRDLSQITGKQINLVMSGADTELDRTVLDAIKDPLTHMVRNSADHGIEPLDVRRATGKPEIGTVRLNAFHEGGHVIICIEDDGAGIARDHVLRKAIETGLVSEADAANLSDAQVCSFIFHAGLSTAKEVSSVSGRGVGMDVVKTAIERIGGTVDLSSTPGQGTIIRIKIPLTLAIISALVVESGGELFAIPQLGIVELVRLHAEERHKIERIHDQKVFRLRDRLLPLVHLNRLLGLPDGDSDHGDVNIVVVQVGEDRFGLIVSAVYDTEEIVVKPVGRLLKDVKLYQGTTILGDGRVIMILDAAAIITRFGGRTTAASDAPKLRDPDAVDNRNTTSLLLFDAGEQTMAVPLSLVARLEEFPRNRLEQAGDRLLVQYRGDLLPLLNLKGTDSSLSGVDLQSVIVFSEGSQSLGLMVDAIRDIIQETLLIRRRSNRPGVLGTAVIGGRAIDVIDTQYYLGQVNPNWFSERESEHFKVLLIDNSSFFRQLATTALEVDGFIVTPVESAVVAVERIEHGDRYDVILSDLDLPMMDGYDFAEWFRLRPEGTDTPLVALTSVHCAMNEDKIFAAGYDCTLIKFNPDEVTRTINRLCQPAQNKCGAHV